MRNRHSAAIVSPCFPFLPVNTSIIGTCICRDTLHLSPGRSRTASVRPGDLQENLCAGAAALGRCDAALDGCAPVRCPLRLAALRSLGLDLMSLAKHGECLVLFARLLTSPLQLLNLAVVSLLDFLDESNVDNIETSM